MKTFSTLIFLCAFLFSPLSFASPEKLAEQFLQAIHEKNEALFLSLMSEDYKNTKSAMSPDILYKQLTEYAGQKLDAARYNVKLKTIEPKDDRAVLTFDLLAKQNGNLVDTWFFHAEKSNDIWQIGGTSINGGPQHRKLFLEKKLPATFDFTKYKSFEELDKIASTILESAEKLNSDPNAEKDIIRNKAFVINNPNDLKPITRLPKPKNTENFWIPSLNRGLITFTEDSEKFFKKKCYVIVEKDEKAWQILKIKDSRKPSYNDFLEGL